MVFFFRGRSLICEQKALGGLQNENENESEGGILEVFCFTQTSGGVTAEYPGTFVSTRRRSLKNESEYNGCSISFVESSFPDSSRPHIELELSPTPQPAGPTCPLLLK